VARPELSDALRGGLLGVAVGEALGLPWVGAQPRQINRTKLLDDVGPTGAVTAAVLAASQHKGGQSPFNVAETSPLRHDPKGGQSPFMLAVALVLGWREPDPLARRAAAMHLGFAPVMVADLAAEGIRAAVRLGGGATARLGALVGGLLACRRPTAVDRIPWRDRVALPAAAELDAAVAALSAGR
jgi:hypothetical protein